MQSLGLWGLVLDTPLMSHLGCLEVAGMSVAPPTTPGMYENSSFAYPQPISLNLKNIAECMDGMEACWFIAREGQKTLLCSGSIYNIA